MAQKNKRLKLQNRSYDKYFLVDTNIILEDSSNILKLSQNGKNLIILSEIVLDEIDAKKSGFDEINFQAREFARFLENSKIVEKKDSHGIKIISLRVDNSEQKIDIDIVSKESYKSMLHNFSPNIANDRKILEIAKELDTIYEAQIQFITQDVMAKFRAISLDISSHSLVGNNIDFDFDFVKEIQIDFEQIEDLENCSILEFDSEYKPFNFSYIFKVRYSDQVLLGNVKNGKISILDEEELRNQPVLPMNKEQLFFANAIKDRYFNVIVVDSIAGSGKTLLALSGAIKLAKQKLFNRIIYIRNSIESLDRGEDVGYLPGLEEKFKIYNHPLMDSLDFIVRNEHKKKRQAKNYQATELEDVEVNERIEMLMQNLKIETMWVGEMRGRTISNAFVIIDEAQNMSNKTMQMVLSRIDNSSKTVILGSNKQIDNFYVNKHTNSLTTLLNSTRKEQELVNIFAIKLNKVLRGKITQWAEETFGYNGK